MALSKTTKNASQFLKKRKKKSKNLKKFERKKIDRISDFVFENHEITK